MYLSSASFTSSSPSPSSIQPPLPHSLYNTFTLLITHPSCFQHTLRVCPFPIYLSRFVHCRLTWSRSPLSSMSFSLYTMATIRRALTRVIPGNRKSRDFSSDPPSPRQQPTPPETIVNGDASPKAVISHSQYLQPQPNGIPNGNGHPVNRRSSRRLSFTEQKVERKVEREAKEEAEATVRHEKQQRCHDQVRHRFFLQLPSSCSRTHVSAPLQDPVRENYGDLPLNMSQQRRGTSSVVHDMY